MIKKITAFTHHTTAEGERLTYTYSEIDNDGNVSKSNTRATMVVIDEDILEKISEIRDFLHGRLPD